MPALQVTASIVLYKPHSTVLKAIQSFLNVTSLSTFLYLVDNSPTNHFQKSNIALLENKNVCYIFTGKNIGYGAAHNIALRRAINKSEYHLVLNPDIYFNADVIEKLYAYAIENISVGQMMPKVLYPGGKLQYVCKLIPTPFNLIARLLPLSIFKKYNYKFELRFTGYNKIMNVPYLQGSFMFLKCSALKEVGLFDERFFLYPEDIDLTRRMHRKYKTLYYPYVHIFHTHTKSSFKSLKLFAVHAYNIIRYFNKWGWFIDRERHQINKAILNELNYKV